MPIEIHAFYPKMWLQTRSKSQGEKWLYKSKGNIMLDGVCGGIAAYFDIDPSLVRLGWVVFCALGVSGILAYIIVALIIPCRPEYLEA